MDVFAVLFTHEWRITTGTAIGLLGLVILGKGLIGARGLLRRKIGLADRLAGWQFTLVGLTLIGLAIAWASDSRLFLVLTLGIAFTELREASTVVNALRHDRRRDVQSGA